MNWSAVGVISSLTIAVISAIIAVVTNVNHVQHLKEEVDTMKKTDEKMWQVIDENKAAIASIAGDIKSMQAVCADRHK